MSTKYQTEKHITSSFILEWMKVFFAYLGTHLLLPFFILFFSFGYTYSQQNYIYYVPLPEQELRSTLKVFTDARNRSMSSSLRTVVSIVSNANNTVMCYDHWEDGYEADIHNPTQSTTQIWGDGDNSNGKPPGYVNDFINAGDIIELDNTVNLPRNPNTIKYDGRDKSDIQ